MNFGALTIAVVLLGLNGFFVAAEFALLASRRSRLEQYAGEGDRRARHALAGVRELSLMLAGAQLGITMASLGLGAVAEPAIAHWLETVLARFAMPEAVLRGVSFTLGMSVVVFLHIVVGEMAPKSLAITNPEKAALRLAGPFRAFTLAVRPFLRLLNATANGIVRLLGVEPQEELAAAHGAGDLTMLVRESAEHGLLAREQHGLLERALVLSGLDAEAAMIPRPDIVAVPGDASLDEIERIASDTGRSRLPVYDGDLDRVLGVLHVKDLLRIGSRERDNVTAASVARPAFVTVESQPIEDLMLEMRDARAHVAVVIDEYGSVSGLVALEDLIEELIGDFDDETDVSRNGGGSSRRRADGTIVVPAALRADEFEDITGIRLPQGDYETIAGYVISELGRLAAEGDVVDAPGCQLRVTKVDATRLVELAVAPTQT